MDVRFTINPMNDVDPVADSNRAEATPAISRF
jgi:hypothetical protein